MNFKKTPIAIALAAFVATPVAMAEQNYHRHHQMNPVSLASIENGQLNQGNTVTNTRNSNDGRLNDQAGQGAHGNIGINAAAGDNNYQDNAAAISRRNASFVFGAAVASVNTDQQAMNNRTTNTGNRNSAGLNGHALFNASGNVAVNSAAGASNLQKNNVSISVANAAMAKAFINSTQSGSGNTASNTGSIKKLTDTTQVTLTGNLNGGYFGWTGGTTWAQQSGSYSGTYQGSSSGHYHGISKEMGGGNHYPGDVVMSSSRNDRHDRPSTLRSWGHYSGSESGTQSGTYSGSSRGGYMGAEMGAMGLAGTFSGQVNSVRYVVTPSVNNASINGSALQNASGNVGVNVAAGSGNLQNNSMALATSNTGTAQ